MGIFFPYLTFIFLQVLKILRTKMSKKNDILKPSRVHFKVTCPFRFKLSV